MEKPRIPFPTERLKKPTVAVNGHVAVNGNKPTAWQLTEDQTISPLCFEVRYRTGEIQAFPYSDFRGYELQHQGYLVINILGMQKSTITVEGRWLGELARKLSVGCIDWIEESRANYELPETEPCIERITFEDLAEA